MVRGHSAATVGGVRRWSGPKWSNDGIGWWGSGSLDDKRSRDYKRRGSVADGGVVTRPVTWQRHKGDEVPPPPSSPPHHRSFRRRSRRRTASTPKPLPHASGPKRAKGFSPSPIYAEKKFHRIAPWGPVTNLKMNLLVSSQRGMLDLHP